MKVNMRQKRSACKTQVVIKIVMIVSVMIFGIHMVWRSPVKTAYFTSAFSGDGDQAKYKCREKHCMERLQSDDKIFYNICLNNTWWWYEGHVTGKDMDGSCHFINGSKRAAVALVSFPGSGNTWVRQLLEKATGICTGAIYCDETIRRVGMNGEGVRSGAVLVTKTHYVTDVTWTHKQKPLLLYLPNEEDVRNRYQPAYSSAILIVRNPYHALISEYTRYLYRKTSGAHTITVNDEAMFVNNKRWNSFVMNGTKMWKEYFRAWLVNGTNRGHRVLAVKYEDIKKNLFVEVKRMLDLLRFRYKERDLQRRLAAGNIDSFKRSHSKTTFDHYTTEQRLLINKAITDTLLFLRSNYSSTLGLEDYLWYD